MDSEDSISEVATAAPMSERRGGFQLGMPDDIRE